MLHVSVKVTYTTELALNLQQLFLCEIIGTEIVICNMHSCILQQFLGTESEQLNVCTEIIFIVICNIHSCNVWEVQ